jgi:hypothetical protein
MAFSMYVNYIDRRPPLVGEVSDNFCVVEKCRMVSTTGPNSH